MKAEPLMRCSPVENVKSEALITEGQRGLVIFLSHFANSQKKFFSLIALIVNVKN